MQNCSGNCGILFVPLLLNIVDRINQKWKHATDNLSISGSRRIHRLHIFLFLIAYKVCLGIRGLLPLGFFFMVTTSIYP